MQPEAIQAVVTLTGFVAFPGIESCLMVLNGKEFPGVGAFHHFSRSRYHAYGLAVVQITGIESA